MKVELHLKAITQSEYFEVIEVPDDITKDELETLTNQRWSQVDPGWFHDDAVTWEKGPCSYSEVFDEPATVRLEDVKSLKVMNID